MSPGEDDWRGSKKKSKGGGRLVSKKPSGNKETHEKGRHWGGKIWKAPTRSYFGKMKRSDISIIDGLYFLY